jgi:hypothetical protein
MKAAFKDLPKFIGCPQGKPFARFDKGRIIHETKSSFLIRVRSRDGKHPQDA